MSNFGVLAKTLVAQQTNPNPSQRSEVKGKFDKLVLLSNAGFSPQDVLYDLRSLYDSCEDDEKQIKKSILEMIVKMNGMLVVEEQIRSAPTFQIVINSESGSRINTMICPPQVVTNG